MKNQIEFYEVSISSKHMLPRSSYYFTEPPTTETLSSLLLHIFEFYESSIVPTLHLGKKYPYLEYELQEEYFDEFWKRKRTHIRKYLLTLVVIPRPFTFPGKMGKHLTNKNSGIREVAKKYFKEN